MVELKVSDTLLSLLSTLALKHTRDKERETGLAHFEVIVSFSIIFLFRWIRIRTDFIIPLFKSACKVYFFVFC